MPQLDIRGDISQGHFPVTPFQCWELLGEALVGDAGMQIPPLLAPVQPR